MTSRKFLMVIFSIVVVSMMTGFSFVTPFTAEAAQKIKFTVATHYPATHQMGKGYFIFADYVNKHAGDKIEVKVYPGAVLLQDIEAVDAISSGTVDAAVCIAAKSAGHLPNLNAVTIPMLWEDHHHFRRTIDNGLYDIFVKEYESKNIKLMNMFPKGAIHVYHKTKHFTKPEDFKGENLRGLGGYITAAIKHLGANAVTIGSPAEVVTALQRGIVKGMTTNYTSYIGRGWYEYAPYATIFNLCEDAEGIGINTDSWKKLPKDLQQVMIEAAKAMNEYEWDLIIKGDEELAIQDFKKRNLHVRVLTPQERKAFAQALQPVWDQAVKGLPMAKRFIELAEKTQ